MTNRGEPSVFIETKAHRQFVEFAQACVAFKYIGVCHGRPGVGKTFSAKQFSRWDLMEHYDIHQALDESVKQKLMDCQAVFYTATVANTPKTLSQGIHSKIYNLGHMQLQIAGEGDSFERRVYAPRHCPLVIMDEADRLSLKSFEQLRDMYDKHGFGLVLLGMPGIEKRLARYPQFYSRIGFIHEFKPLSHDEMRFIFEKYWHRFGFAFDGETFADVEAMNTTIRITQGNFRLIDRLFSQIQRILTINKVERITMEVVEAARNCLVIGKL